MPRIRRRLILSACVLLAGVLAGLPDSTALERAVSKVFLQAAPAIAPTPAGTLPVTARVIPRNVAAPETARADAAPPVSPERHRLILRSLYTSFVTLQVLDVHSTLMAMDRGARETNPVMAPLVDRPAAFVALKAGTAAGILYMTERVRRQSPLAAVILMAAFNSTYATIVARNYGVASRLAR